MKLQEKDIEIDFINAIDAIVFDQMDSGLPNYHGISEMRKVDFVVEFEDSVIFVELKDPLNANTDRISLNRFREKLQNGTLCKSFASKFIDTFFYRWAEKKLDKTVHYLSLVTLDSEELPVLSDEIGKLLLPFGRNSPRWQRHPVENCQVFNIETWNANFPKWPARRISAA